jgi:hypothetical protein
MEEAPENGKVSSHYAHANGMNECFPPKSLATLPLNSTQSATEVYKSWAQVTQETKVCLAAPNICVSPVQNLQHVTLTVPRIFKVAPNFCVIYVFMVWASDSIINKPQT